MRKSNLFLVFGLLLSTGIFTGCESVQKTKNVGSSDELHEVTKECDVRVAMGNGPTKYDYYGTEININITNDFTIMTEDYFFTWDFLNNYLPGRILENMTFNGNGHTITIKGETTTKLGLKNRGIFARVENCIIKDLNIVYDLDLNMSGSDGSYYGGFSKSSVNSTFQNCTVSYKRNTNISFLTDAYGFHDSRFGGLVATSKGSEFINCRVEGDLEGTAGYFGGIVGTLGADDKLHDCIFDGSITANRLEECFIGGIAGYVNETAEIYSSKVLIDEFNIIGKPQGWRYETSAAGCLVGNLKGNLHDAYVEFKENGYCFAESISSGMFYTTLHKGMIAGIADEGSKIKNVYVDGLNDNTRNIKFAETPLSFAYGIGNNKSTEISLIYFIDDKYYYEYEESSNGILLNEDDNFKLYEFEINGAKCTAKVISTYDDEDNEYKIDKVELTIDNEIYELNYESLLSNASISEFLNDDIDEYTYRLRIYHSNTIIFNKYLNYSSLGESVFVDSYENIIFDFQEEVIGGTENYWKKDPVTNKPLLKSID